MYVGPIAKVDGFCISRDFARVGRNDLIQTSSSGKKYSSCKIYRSFARVYACILEFAYHGSRMRLYVLCGYR